MKIYVPYIEDLYCDYNFINCTFYSSFEKAVQRLKELLTEAFSKGWYDAIDFSDDVETMIEIVKETGNYWDFARILTINVVE